MARPHPPHLLCALAPLIAAFLASSALAEPEPKPKPKPDDGAVARAGEEQLQASAPADSASQAPTKIIGVLRGAELKASVSKAAQHPGGANLATTKVPAPVAAVATIGAATKPFETPPPK